MPTDPETALLQMRAAIGAALADGERRLCVDVQTPELQASTRGFDPELLARFALAAADSLASASAPTDDEPLLLMHTMSAALRAQLLLREGINADRVRLTCPSWGDAGGPPSSPLVIVGPDHEAESDESRMSRERALSAGSPLVLLNWRPAASLDSASIAQLRAAPLRRRLGFDASWAPPDGFELVYEILPLALRQKEGGADGGGGGGAASKVVLRRSYPQPWVMLCDSGTGYEEKERYARRPDAARLLETASDLARREGTAESALKSAVGGAAVGDAPQSPMPNAAPRVGASRRAKPGVGSAGGSSADADLAAHANGAHPCRAYCWPALQDDHTALRAYATACRLRLAGGGAAAPPYAQIEGTWHLFGATDAQWSSRPLELAACGLLRFDGDVAVLEPLVVDVSSNADESGDEARWRRTLADLAETIARRGKLRSLRVPDDARLTRTLEYS